MENNIIFCRLLLKEIRKKIKTHKIKVPKLESYTDGRGWWEIFSGHQSKNNIWSGYASNAYEARYNALSTFLEGR